MLRQGFAIHELWNVVVQVEIAMIHTHLALFFVVVVVLQRQFLVFSTQKLHSLSTHQHYKQTHKFNFKQEKTRNKQTQKLVSFGFIAQMTRV